MDAPISPFEPTPSTSPAAPPSTPTTTPSLASSSTPAPTMPSTTKPTASRGSNPPPPPVSPPTESSGWAWKIIVIIAVLLALGVIGTTLWNSYYIPQPNVQTTPSSTPSILESNIIPESAVPTSTNIAVTSTDIIATSTNETTTASSTTDSVRAFSFGSTVQFFVEDEIRFDTPPYGNTNKALNVKATGFTDSRCAPGNTCVWAGEHGINLRITELRTGNTQDINLGMIRTKAVTVLGHTFTLIDINEGKGGTFAEVRVD